MGIADGINFIFFISGTEIKKKLKCLFNVTIESTSQRINNRQPRPVIHFLEEFKIHVAVATNREGIVKLKPKL